MFLQFYAIIVIMKESQRRSDYVKRSLDVFHSYASREPYKTRIDALYQTGMRATVLDTAFNPEIYEPVTFIDGVPTELPFDDSSNSIGVVAIRPDESTSVVIGSHPLQEIASLPSILEVSFPYGAGGSVQNIMTVSNIAIGNSAVVRAYVYHRPTLILPYDDKRTHEYPSVLAHEFLHNAQQIDQQTRVYDASEAGEGDRMIDDYNREFDAYRLQYDMFIDEIDETLMDPTMSKASEVALYRKRLLGSADGYATRETLDDIRRHYSIGRILLRAYISG